MTEPAKGPYAIAAGNAAWDVLAADGDLLANVAQWYPPEQRDANARLLAASWEMREALAEIAGLGDVDCDLAPGIAARVLAKVRSET